MKMAETLHEGILATILLLSIVFILTAICDYFFENSYWRCRIVTLKSPIKIIFSISILSVLLMELCFRNVPAFNELLYSFGQIFLKFCYSAFAAIIIYFFNIHLPKEEKKIKTWLSISTKYNHLKEEANFILSHIGFDVDSKSFLRPSIEEIGYCINRIKISGVNILANGETVHFPDFRQFLDFKSERISLLTSELYTFQELLDTEILVKTLRIRDTNTSHFSLGGRSMLNIETEYDRAIFDLVNASRDVNFLFSKTSQNYGRFAEKILMESAAKRRRDLANY